ncbi:uncharacterized protein V6R79_011875 [Siganus canaliculatus]
MKTHFSMKNGGLTFENFKQQIEAFLKVARRPAPAVLPTSCLCIRHIRVAVTADSVRSGPCLLHVSSNHSSTLGHFQRGRRHPAALFDSPLCKTSHHQFYREKFRPPYIELPESISLAKSIQLRLTSLNTTTDLLGPAGPLFESRYASVFSVISSRPEVLPDSQLRKMAVRKNRS